MKGLANRHSLSRHKKTCQVQPFQGRKRSSDVEAETLSKNPRIEALANAIINDTNVDRSNKLPAADIFRNKTLPSPPSRAVDVFQKLPSPPSHVVADVFKLPRTKKDLVGYSDDGSSTTDDEEKSDSENGSSKTDDDNSSNSENDSLRTDDDDDDNCSNAESRSSTMNEEITENAERPVIKLLPSPSRV